MWKIIKYVALVCSLSVPLGAEAKDFTVQVWLLDDLQSDSGKPLPGVEYRRITAVGGEAFDTFECEGMSDDQGNIKCRIQKCVDRDLKRHYRIELVLPDYHIEPSRNDYRRSFEVISTRRRHVYCRLDRDPIKVAFTKRTKVIEQGQKDLAFLSQLKDRSIIENEVKHILSENGGIDRVLYLQEHFQEMADAAPQTTSLDLQGAATLFSSLLLQRAASDFGLEKFVIVTNQPDILETEVAFVTDTIVESLASTETSAGNYILSYLTSAKDSLNRKDRSVVGWRLEKAARLSQELTPLESAN